MLFNFKRGEINMNKKHNWTVEEEVICCAFYKYFFVMNNSKDVDTIVDILYQMLNKNIGKNSIKMKLQNIKTLMNDNSYVDSFPLKSLQNYSKLNEDVFYKIF